MKKLSIIAIIIAALFTQGCSKSVRDKWLYDNYDYFPPQYEGRTDSVAGIEAREALDSLSFYIKRGVKQWNLTASHEDYYKVLRAYDIFVHNGEIIIHDCYGDDYIGKIKNVNVEHPSKGKYDYILILYGEGKYKISQSFSSFRIFINILPYSDKVICGNGSTYGRVEPLIGPPERYRQSYFNQTLNPAKTIIANGDTIRIR